LNKTTMDYGRLIQCRDNSTSCYSDTDPCTWCFFCWGNQDSYISHCDIFLADNRDGSIVGWP
jgi:hypothetical protein